MHEHGIADRLLETALEIARERGISRISKVVIGIGALTGLSEESLLEPLQHVADHFNMNEIKFGFERVLPTASCKSCDRDIAQEPQCPWCGSGDIEITGGLDVFVKEVSGVKLQLKN